MRLVEQHVIKRVIPAISALTRPPKPRKNLWNVANYLVWQSFIFQGVYLNNTAVFHLLKTHEAYQALPRKVCNQVLIQLHKAWVGFFEAMAEWREHPERFTGRAAVAWLQAQNQGRSLLVYEKGAIWKRELDQGVIAVSEPGALVQTARAERPSPRCALSPKVIIT